MGLSREHIPPTACKCIHQKIKRYLWHRGQCVSHVGQGAPLLLYTSVTPIRPSIHPAKGLSVHDMTTSDGRVHCRRRRAFAGQWLMCAGTSHRRWSSEAQWPHSRSAAAAGHGPHRLPSSCYLAARCCPWLLVISRAYAPPPPTWESRCRRVQKVISDSARPISAGSSDSVPV